jgi:hypothetical protein
MSETYYGPDFTLLQKQDPDIAAVLLSELKRLQTDLQLIASENLTSRAVLATLGSTLSNKYAEGYPGKRYYGGCEEVDKAEEIAINRAKSLFGAEHANVQPHSGASAIKHLPSQETPFWQCLCLTVDISRMDQRLIFLESGLTSFHMASVKIQS